MTFAELVRSTRAARKLTQQDLAELVGVTRQTIGAIEKGNDLRLSLAIRINQVLGFSLAGIE